MFFFPTAAAAVVVDYHLFFVRLLTKDGEPSEIVTKFFFVHADVFHG